MKITQQDIYELSDEELCAALIRFSTMPLESHLLNPKEREMATGFREAYIRYGGLTWKQRQTARYIISRNTERLQRSKEAYQWDNWKHK